MDPEHHRTVADVVAVIREQHQPDRRQVVGEPAPAADHRDRQVQRAADMAPRPECTCTAR